MTESLSMGALVAALPEKYQPIFAHPELTDGSSRGCEDRLLLIRQCAQRLQATLGRPLRVLDLGCAQGFFSLNLAADGHTVHGVDFLDLNVNVCKALAAENPSFAASFEHGTVEDVIDRLEPGRYDLVLGLSVFHHLVHARGILSVSELCRKLSEKTAAGVFELALHEEPLYWAPSLPQDPAEILSSYAFLRLLSRQETHLSAVSRPLYFASSQFWYVDGIIGDFTSWTAESHAHGRGTHLQSRRYYFGPQVFVKRMTLAVEDRAEINLREFVNEVEFLSNPPLGYPAPRLIASLNDSRDLFLARSMMDGRLLSQAIDDGSAYDADEIIAQILEQLVLLERAGLYHNDVRCWNILITPEMRAVLIDYGAISTNAADCSWLEDLLFSFLITVKEILERRVVSPSPSREPALDFTTLPARYCNAFVALFGQNRSQLTFALLQQCLQQADAAPAPLPEWASIYRRLHDALLVYNARLSAVHIETEHHRVELASRGAAIEQFRESALKEQGRIQLLEQQIAASESRCQRLEEDSEKLAAWAKGLEAQAIASAALQARVAAQQQQMSQLENSREQDRNRVKELQADLSRSMQIATAAREHIRGLELAVEVLEGQIDSLHASRSWRITAPLRLFTTRVLKRGDGNVAIIRNAPVPQLEDVATLDGSVPTPAEAAMDKRVAAVDQLGSRIRKLRK
ncbi:methyltransferase domain-containing protein [Xanthomonas nasturtii]|uniref:Methyltransferase domain-containing protein n=1 Tax=Xanthomonas nasturtii TaxID=1843581 RepID=A0ABT0LRH5_9XANT|nr:methyltransferase domain-containing protein [Xanthomonas nasturtii]MCL1551747.1 methyltransferase domain-containing protein [Xanthomonas nasturtii]MCL1556066.1 methyltransferase domain-containing protein [Xanthomonas nasturtii]MCL1558394.1 methyltransferase domain-containing protein [Xanthomonas nasturtii]